MRRAVTVWAGLGVLAVLTTAGAPAARAQAAAPSLKIGFISSRQILQQTPGYAAAESTFTKELQSFRDEVQKLQQQLDSAARAFDQQQIALSPTAKQQKQRDLQQMQQRFEQRSNDLQTRAQQRETELLQPIQARVNAVIQGLRAEGNYTLIFDADAPNSNIVAADPTLDITRKVLARLKQAQ
jgi:outer membrane protein